MLFLLFRIGGDRYALEARRVIEIVPMLEMKRMPRAPEGVAGVFNYRGMPVPAVDLSALTTGIPAAERLSTRIIVVNYESPLGTLHPLGLIAEQATEILRRESHHFTGAQTHGTGAAYLGPVLTDEKGSIQWLYEERLLSEPVREMLFAPGAPSGI